MRVTKPRRRRYRLTKVMDTFNRARMIDSVMDTGLYDRRRDAATAVDAVAGVIRAWIIAWCTDCPQPIEARIQIPGAMSLSLAWCKFTPDSPPLLRLYCRLTRDAELALYHRRRRAIKQWETENPELAATNAAKRAAYRSRKAARSGNEAVPAEPAANHAAEPNIGPNHRE